MGGCFEAWWSLKSLSTQGILWFVSESAFRKSPSFSLHKFTIYCLTVLLFKYTFCQYSCLPAWRSELTPFSACHQCRFDQLADVAGWPVLGPALLIPRCHMCVPGRWPTPGLPRGIHSLQWVLTSTETFLMWKNVLVGGVFKQKETAVIITHHIIKDLKPLSN